MPVFRRKNDATSAMPTTWRGTAHSDAGGIALWSRDAFSGLAADDWDHELCEDADVERHIEAAELVPVFLGFDGAFAVELRTESALQDRELRYLVARGRGLYRLEVGQGGAWISGLEHVSPKPRAGFAADLAAGSWSIELAMICWEDEPGSKDADGRPVESALPDFVLLARPVAVDDTHAAALEAFERPA
jgi:hypothetical protein